MVSRAPKAAASSGIAGALAPPKKIPASSATFDIPMRESLPHPPVALYTESASRRRRAFPRSERSDFPLEFQVLAQEGVRLAQHLGAYGAVQQAVIEILVHDQLARLAGASQLPVHDARLADVDVQVDVALEHEHRSQARVGVLGRRSFLYVRAAADEVGLHEGILVVQRAFGLEQVQ